jgi:PKD repeat protein
MTDTHGFEVILEAGTPVIQKVLRGAWKSAECPDEPGDEGRIPENLKIPDDTGPVSFGGYTVEDGQIQIPQNELDGHFIAGSTAELKLGLHLQSDIKDPPVPSAGLFDMTADLRANVPIGTLPNSVDVAVLLDGLPRGNVNVTLTSGDPLAPKLDTLLKEYLHKLYEDGTIPHNKNEKDHVIPTFLGPITVDVDVQIYDDEVNPAHRIDVSRPQPDKLQISVPIYLRMYHIREEIGLINLCDPMGVETRLIITGGFASPPGKYIADFTSATVSVQQPLTPATGDEGANYTENRNMAIIGPLLETSIVSALTAQGHDFASGIGPVEIDVPTVAQIEGAIGDFFHSNLVNRKFLSIWRPEASGSVLTVNNIAVRTLNDAMIIAINAGGGADVNAITNFIPVNREFAIALSADRVQQSIDKSRADNDLEDGDLPKRFHQNGKDVDLKELDVFLVDGAIRVEGKVTVIDAILDSIDVDADFDVDVGLHWEPNGALNADGGQLMGHDTLNENVDPEESVLFWVITIILAIVSFGLGGIGAVLILAIVIIIVEAIASDIGGSMLKDPVDGTLKGITAWPPGLAKIGRVIAIFDDPIEIKTTGLLMAGTMQVESGCEATHTMAANSGGAYIINAASPVMLSAVNLDSAASYRWLAGDGSPLANVQNLSHTYAASGLYIAKHSLTINQTGGDTSRHFALVTVRNVPPTVDAGPDITVHEGEVVTLVGTFQDIEYPDTHESTWNFGDSQAIEPGVIQETNNPPHAQGISTVKHAWCDNGEYTVTLMVRDQNGGIATDTRRVTVLNVPPTVMAGPHMYAYPCTAITLVGHFTDPGWCDTHKGFWELGDCTPPQTAVIREKHEPPAGEGTATVTHIYRECGTYRTRCVVIDDDGGEGEDTSVVDVIDVLNPDFEGGFRRRRQGQVANYWEPYVAPAETLQPAQAGASAGLQAEFSCEECDVHSGQRAQCILPGRLTRSGIYQKVGANPGWDYQLSVWYSQQEGAGGVARLGIDPAGGSNPAASGIVWNTGMQDLDWAQLTERVPAQGEAITIFLEAESMQGSRGAICFDDVSLIPIQPFCPEGEPEPPKPRQRQCFDFGDFKPDTEMPPKFKKDGFEFISMEKRPLRMVAYGPPPNTSKLQLSEGLLVDLPFEADEVLVRLVQYGSSLVEFIAIDRDGAVVGMVQSAEKPAPELQTLTISAPSIIQIQITTKGRESLLFEICISSTNGKG